MRQGKPDARFHVEKIRSSFATRGDGASSLCGGLRRGPRSASRGPAPGPGAGGLRPVPGLHIAPPSPGPAHSPGHRFRRRHPGSIHLAPARRHPGPPHHQPPEARAASHRSRPLPGHPRAAGRRGAQGPFRREPRHRHGEEAPGPILARGSSSLHGVRPRSHGVQRSAGGPRRRRAARAALSR